MLIVNLYFFILKYPGSTEKIILLSAMEQFIMDIVTLIHYSTDKFHVKKCVRNDFFFQ